MLTPFCSPVGPLTFSGVGGVVPKGGPILELRGYLGGWAPEPIKSISLGEFVPATRVPLEVAVRGCSGESTGLPFNLAKDRNHSRSTNDFREATRIKRLILEANRRWIESSQHCSLQTYKYIWKAVCLHQQFFVFILWSLNLPNCAWE